MVQRAGPGARRVRADEGNVVVRVPHVCAALRVAAATSRVAPTRTSRLRGPKEKAMPASVSKIGHIVLSTRPTPHLGTMRPTRRPAAQRDRNGADVHVHIQAAFWPRDPARTAPHKGASLARPEHRRDNLRLVGVAIQQHAPGKYSAGRMWTCWPAWGLAPRDRPSTQFKYASPPASQRASGRMSGRSLVIVSGFRHASSPCSGSCTRAATNRPGRLVPGRLLLLGHTPRT